MTAYNSSILYNQPLVTYNGIVLVITDSIVVNSETVTTLQITDVPVYANIGVSVYDQAAYALTSLIEDIQDPNSSVSVFIDKENSYATITATTADPNADGSISITIISNV